MHVGLYVILVQFIIETNKPKTCYIHLISVGGGGGVLRSQSSPTAYGPHCILLVANGATSIIILFTRELRFQPYMLEMYA